MTLAHRLLVVSASAWIVGCAHHHPPAAPPAPSTHLPVASPTLPPASPIVLQRDPIIVLIGEVEKTFEQGDAELKAGHLEAARTHFDAAVDRLLAQPGGVRSDPRLSTAFDQLLDRISALDVLALRMGNGFTETKSEPAIIDELLGEAMFDHPLPTLSTAELVADDIAHTPHDLEIPANNAKILSYVELFQGRLHQFMEEGLTRGMRYMPMIEKVFKEAGLPLDLAYVPLVESAFKPNALSRASARGMWQFIRDTGLEHGLDQNWFVDERSDPEKATRAAATYLKTLSEMFDNDWNLALASYNAGPGRIQRATKLSKSFDYWKMTASTKYLPRETREYVPMILAAVLIAKNPARYGFDLGPAEPLAYETVTVPGALDLHIIAEWAGVTLEDIQGLNPELRRTMTPTVPHEVKLPLGTAASVRAKLEGADPTLFRKFTFHTVTRGETVASIAKKTKVTVPALRQANDLTSKSRLRVGQELMLPPPTAVALPARPTAAATTTASAAPKPSSSGGSPLIYRVKPGDTLIRIAKLFDTTVTDLKRLNRLSSDSINIGDRLTVRR